MKPPQFSLAGILWATFWMAICFVAWATNPPEWSIQGPHQGWVFFAFVGLRFITIPTAIGALFGRTLRGLLVGTALYVGLAVLMIFALLVG
jgi:hypothetical protein